MPAQRRHLWLILALETAFFVALAIWVLTRLDRLFEPVSLLIAALIIGLGDLVTVLIMQRFAPTKVTFETGEQGHSVGEVLDGFGNDNRGRVVVRGERWVAHTSETSDLLPGDRIRVVTRTGLTLRVERVD